MPMPWRLQFAHTFTCEVMIATESQVDAWSPIGGSLRHWLDDAIKVGILGRTKVIAAEPLPATEPLLVWENGDPIPDAEHISHLAIQRMKRPTRRITVFYARNKAVRFSGRQGWPKGPFDATHALQLTEVFNYYRRATPELSWLLYYDFLDYKRPRVGYVPDAWLFDKLNIPKLKIEVVGSYGPERLRDLHRPLFGYERGGSYALW